MKNKFNKRIITYLIVFLIINIILFAIKVYKTSLEAYLGSIYFITIGGLFLLHISHYEASIISKYVKRNHYNEFKDFLRSKKLMGVWNEWVVPFVFSGESFNDDMLKVMKNHFVQYCVFLVCIFF